MPSKIDNRRKIAFALRPHNSPADEALLALFDGLSTADRARIYRVCLLAGAALRQQNAQAVSVLAESLSEGQSLESVRALLSGAMPELFSGRPAPNLPDSQLAPAAPPAQTTPVDEFTQTARQKFGVQVK